MLLESIPANYELLITTCTNIATNNGLRCAIPIHVAVSYDNNSDKDLYTFYRINTSEDIPQPYKDLLD